MWMGEGCWCPGCIVRKILAAILGAFALALLVGTASQQFGAVGLDFLTASWQYFWALALGMIAKKLLWCHCCGMEMPAKRRR